LVQAPKNWIDQKQGPWKVATAWTTHAASVTFPAPGDDAPLSLLPCPGHSLRHSASSRPTGSGRMASSAPAHAPHAQEAHAAASSRCRLATRRHTRNTALLCIHLPTLAAAREIQPRLDFPCLIRAQEIFPRWRLPTGALGARGAAELLAMQFL
jgi:hypothetical protein